jgi:GTP-binding protein
VLLDSRLKPQKIDLEFMEMLGVKGIPFVMVFTKLDKLSSSVANKNLTTYKKEMLKAWEALPPIILTSSSTKQGREEVLKIIEDTNKDFVFKR